MKRFLSFAIIALITLASFAQNNPRNGNRNQDMTPDQVAEMQTKRMAQNLNLTDEQQKEVYALNKEMAEKRQERRSDRMASRQKGERPTQEEIDKMKKEQQEFQAEHQERLKKILTKEQYDTWQKNMANRRDYSKNRMKDNWSKKKGSGKKQMQNPGNNN